MQLTLTKDDGTDGTHPFEGNDSKSNNHLYNSNWSAGILVVSLESMSDSPTLGPPAAEPHAPNPAFGPLVFPSYERLQELGHCRYVVPKSELCVQNECQSVISVLESGFVKLVFLAPDGSEHILGLRGSGYIVGAETILKDHPVRYSVVTTTPVLIRSIPRLAFSRVVDADPEMLRHLNTVVCQESEAEVQQQIGLRAESALTRLRRFLREVPCAGDPGDVFRTLGLRQRDIAHLLSISPEHLARLLTALRPSHA
jgi:CRP-like cAMP-binding protein